VQEYFLRLIEGDVLAAADPVKGRFRSFLLTDCAFFLGHRRARAAARKRGGGRRIVPNLCRSLQQRFVVIEVAGAPTITCNPDDRVDRTRLILEETALSWYPTFSRFAHVLGRPVCREADLFLL